MNCLLKYNALLTNRFSAFPIMSSLFFFRARNVQLSPKMKGFYRGSSVSNLRLFHRNSTKLSFRQWRKVCAFALIHPDRNEFNSHTLKQSGSYYNKANQHPFQYNHFYHPNKDIPFSKVSFRCYSQNAFKKDSLQSSVKWILISSSVGLAATLLYKVFIADKGSPSDEISTDHEKKDQSVGPPRTVAKFPSSSDEIPSDVPYLLIGGGTASFSAFRAIKALDPTARVLMVTDEPYYPYMRPPLTKELIYNKDREAAQKMLFTQWNGSQRSVFFEPEEFYLPCKDLIESETGGVCVARGWKVVELNPELKYVVLEDGKKINYKKCLLATGAVPKNIPVFLNSEAAVQKKVTVYRNLQDFIELEKILESGAKSVAIIGGGFTGSELACSLARRGIQVCQIFKEDANMAQVLPNYLSSWLSSKIEKQGVVLFKKSEVDKVDLHENKVRLTTKNNETIVADHVIVATGVNPNTDLATSASLEVHNTLGGYVVNAELEARSGLFAAGDCACFYDQQLGRRRVEHHDHAVTSGRLAGENMAGAGKPFVHQSMFWSDFGPELGYEAIGIVDSSLPTVAVYLKNSDKSKQSEVEETKETSAGLDYTEDSPDEFQQGVVFYLRNEKVVGIVMWNIFNRISIARQVLRSNIGLENLREAAKLFNIAKTSFE